MAERLPYDYTRMALDDARKEIAALEARWEKLKEETAYRIRNGSSAAEVRVAQGFLRIMAELEETP